MDWPRVKVSSYAIAILKPWLNLNSCCSRINSEQRDIALWWKSFWTELNYRSLYLLTGITMCFYRKQRTTKKSGREIKGQIPEEWVPLAPFHLPTMNSC